MPANPYIDDHKSKAADPLVGFIFKLDLSGKTTGYFTECSGLGSETQVIEHNVVDGSGHEIIRKLPGRLKWGDVTLKRGITDDLDIWKWRDEVVLGNIDTARVHATISMLDRTYSKTIAEWTLKFCWPSKVTGPALKSDSNEFGVEELIIVHEGLARTK